MPARRKTRIRRGHITRRRLTQPLAILLAFAASTAGMHTVLQDARWWLLGLLLTVVVLGSSLAAAALGAGRILSPLVAAGALVATLTIVFAADTAFLGFVPTGESAQRFSGLLRDSVQSITWQSVPATAGTGITCLIGIGIGALVLLADIVAFSLRLPALVGLPLVAVFLVPGLTPAGSTDGFWFAATAVSYLWLLLIGRPRQTVPALAIGVVAVIVGLVLPGALPGVDLTVTTSSLGASVITGVNPVLSLGDDLRRGAEKTALTYSTLSNDPHYLRLTTVQDFSGTDWGPSEPSLDSADTPVQFGDPPGLSSQVPTDREISYVNVANLWSPWLPVPYPTMRVTGLTGKWLWDPESLTVASNNSLARGENYTVTSLLVDPTPEQLQAAGTIVPAGLNQYLELPGNVPSVIADTAARVTAGAGSNYERAVGLQQFFRGGDFTYSEQTPVTDGYDGTGMAVIAAFLDKRSGYCIQFASAMAVMARTLGIPSRIAVGFLPGTESNETDQGRTLYEVTTHDLHTWPELYFDGIGWVPFEPTASRGVIPDYANQANAGVPAPLPLPSSSPAPSQSPSVAAPGRSPQIDNGPTVAGWLSGANWGGWLTLIGALAAAIALVLLPAGIRLTRRRRCLAALRNGTGTAAGAWREVIEAARDVGVRLSPVLTPREMDARLARTNGMTAAGRDALNRLRQAVEKEGYGSPDDPGPGALAADLRSVVGALMAGTDAGGRIRAILLPSSLLPSSSRLFSSLLFSSLWPRFARRIRGFRSRVLRRPA